MFGRDLRFALTVLLAGCGGCTVDHYRATTTLETDGQVFRAVLQPLNTTSAAAEKSERWEHITFAATSVAEDAQHPIPDLPLRPQSDMDEYFAAWGRFASYRDIPLHFKLPVPLSTRAAKLNRAVHRKDFGFVTEHVWIEVLEDIVTLADSRRAQDELWRMTVEFVREVGALQLDKQHDTDQLLAWLRTTGGRWFREACDIYYDVSARYSDEIARDLHLRKALLALCRQHGLSLQDDSGALLDETARQAAISEYVTARLQATLTRKDKRPLKPETINTILEWLNLRDDGQGNDAGDAERQAMSKFVVEKLYRNQENFEQQLNNRLARILGAYRQPIFVSPRQFIYRMTMPGMVVETSGRLVSASQVEWRFSANRASPFGYRMSCRSLETQSDAVESLLSADVLKTRADVLQYVELLSGDDELWNTVRKCVEQGRLSGLIDLKSRIDASTDNGIQRRQKRLAALWKLLALKP